MPIIFSHFWHVALCPTSIFHRGILLRPIGAFRYGNFNSISHNDLQFVIVWHFAPQGVWHFAPPRHYAPAFFAHFIFLARFSEFWHDFRPEILLLARYKPLPPKELQSTINSHKSLVSKELRSAGQAFRS